MTANSINFKRFQRGWRIVIIFTAAFWMASLIFSLFSTPIYRASARFLVYPNDSLTSSRDVVSSLDTLDKRTISTTYADILDSNRVYQDTLDRLNLAPAQLEKVIVYSEVQTNTNILVLNVEGPDPQVITLLANTIGQNGISYIKSIYQVFDISFLDTAAEPEKPIRPKPFLYGLIAAGIGLVLGLLFILLRDMLRIPLETLRERAITDKQSLAYTKNYGLKALTQELAQKKSTPPAFGLIRLEGMEDLIDGLPERITSIVMQNVVQRLHAMLRGNDLVVRWDPLVFSVMLPSTLETPAQKTFERLLQALEESITVQAGEVIQLSPAAGLAIGRLEDTSDMLTLRAEVALQSARGAGTSLVVGK
jgi:capsular polysaccharide biosynthesis protein